MQQLAYISLGILECHIVLGFSLRLHLIQARKTCSGSPVFPTKSRSRGHPTQFVEGRGRSEEQQAAPSLASPVVTGNISSLLAGEVTIVTIQFSSVTQSCLTICDSMNHSTPGLPVHHHLPEFTQTHVHRVSECVLRPDSPTMTREQSRTPLDRKSVV